jgi:glycosyltransferase involved in cell wall biosynthesis
VFLASNAAFPERWTAANGETGGSVRVRTPQDFLAVSARHPETVWVVDCDPRLTFQLAALKAAQPLKARRLVAVDIVLRRPRGFIGRMGVFGKRVLLRQVDHFIHYFRDVRGYEEVFGIEAARSSFVGFKPNLGSRQDLPTSSEGEYVLCFGRSLRDFDTFFEAMEQLPYPAAIAQPDVQQLRAHGGRFSRSLEQLPANVRVLQDDGGEEAQIRILQGARFLVLPITAQSIAASGISTALNAMLLGKCVIGSEGPGMADVFGDAVLTVRPEDAAELAAAIRNVWEDGTLREKTAKAGTAYALQLGGEAELYQRIIDEVAGRPWLRR